MLSAVASQRVGGGTPLTPSGSAADPKPEEQVDRNEPMDIAGAGVIISVRPPPMTASGAARP